MWDAQDCGTMNFCRELKTFGDLTFNCNSVPFQKQIHVWNLLEICGKLKSDVRELSLCSYAVKVYIYACVFS